MKSIPFVGRKRELDSLNALFETKVANLVVVKGRRRIGKSRLVKEFAREKKLLSFVGLPPNKQTTAQSQRDEFANQLSRQTSIPDVKVNDWNDLFLLLAKEAVKGQTIILLDEISWMGTKDPDFLGKLKNAWDNHLKTNPELMLILCGSVSSWIEKNIIRSTGFFGRISLKITLNELSLPSCNQLLHHVGFKRSTFEKLAILSVTGGVPWYLELINSSFSADENIKRLCFTKDGILVDEFKFIFHDLFGRRGKICQDIVEYISKNPSSFSDITKYLNYSRSGSLSIYLEDLEISGFISRQYTWTLSTGKDMKLSKYHLRDNYLRFYLKYIAPRLNKIRKGQFEDISIVSLPNWNSLMGLQFENLVLNNRKLIHQALGIRPEEIVNDNPYFQPPTAKHKGCQIDYLIQTQRNTLFACEIKFSKDEIDPSILSSMKEKISRIPLPRGFACIPVLIHVNGVHQKVEEQEYFYKVIDFAQLLNNDV